MKIAIIGSGPIALEAAARFILLEANILLYSPQKPPASVEAQAELFANSLHFVSWDGLREAHGGQLLEAEGQELPKGKEYPTLHQYSKLYLRPLNEIVKSKVTLREFRAQRVSKSFITPSQKVARLRDLFRVVYLYIPKREIESAELKNQEVFSQIDQVDIAALAAPLERYDEVDLVIEAIGLSHSPMGAGAAFAINEEILLKANHAIYQKIGKVEGLEKMREVAVVGQGHFAYFWIKLLKAQGPAELVIHWISNGLKFEHNDCDIQDILKSDQIKYDEKVRQHQSKVFEYREKPDYIRVKLKEPAEPQKIIRLSELSLISLDYLSDQQGLFLTFGDADSMQSFKVDALFNGLPKVARKSLGVSLVKDEPGYYTLAATEKSAKKSLDEIVENVMTFFSPREEI